MYDQQKTKRQRIEEPAKPRRRAPTMKTVEKPLRKKPETKKNQHGEAGRKSPFFHALVESAWHGLPLQ